MSERPIIKTAYGNIAIHANRAMFEGELPGVWLEIIEKGEETAETDAIALLPLPAALKLVAAIFSELILCIRLTAIEDIQHFFKEIKNGKS